jgi:putative effector of murein hydrolase
MAIWGKVLGGAAGFAVGGPLGALFGAAAHGVGTAKAREIGSEEGVVSSLTMMIAGVAMVLIAPLLTLLPI